MDGFALATAILRGLHLAALLSLFGTLVFAVTLAPPVVQARLARLAWVSAGAALVTGAGWLILEAEAIGGTLAALPVVVTGTRFGQLVTLRLALLAVVVPLLPLPLREGAGGRGRPEVAATGGASPARPPPPTPSHTGRGNIVRRLVALFLSAVALVLQAAIGHAGATGTGLAISESLHLLAAGAWLGALLPLLITLRLLPASDAARICERFTPIGLAAVLVLGGTGIVQGLQLIGSIPALFGTGYGRIALLKAAFFLLALAFAARNRLSLTDRLAGAAPDRAKRQLRRSITAETAIGLLIVLAAGLLASLPPGVHEQPDWPFPDRFSLVAMEDPDLRQEVILATAVIAGGLCVLAASLIWGRFRIPAALLAASLTFWWGPSLGLLLVEAYPTSFYTSPTGFAVTSILRGQALYPAHCAGCHGATGQGNGADGAHLRIRPADLTEPHLWGHSDGELFWWLTHGVDDPEGGLAMPGFADRLSAEDRWALIDAIRARNLGAAIQAEGTWPQPVLAPDLPIQCTGGVAAQASQLRGQAVIVVADTASALAATPVVPPQDGFPIAVLHLRQGAARGDCAAATPDAWPAYAILAGLPPERLAGTVFLVDPAGWLRTLWPPGEAGDTTQLIAGLRSICEHPIDPSPGDGHDHHHH